jgi:hypothetical protein
VVDELGGVDIVKEFRPLQIPVFVDQTVDDGFVFLGAHLRSFRV